MTGRTLVLLRHGRTAWNLAKRVQGQLEVGLDEVGHAQAAAVVPVLAALAPSRIWCSDLQRTRETVAPIAAATGLTPTYDARLREFFFGEREGATHDEYAAAYPAEHARFVLGDYDSVPSAESTAAVRERMTAALGELVAGLEPDALGIAVSHGAAIRVAVCALLGWPDDAFHTLRGLDNCGWVVLEQQPATGRLMLVAYNRQA